MKRYFLLFVIIIVSAFSAIIDRSLIDALQNSDSETFFPIIIMPEREGIREALAYFIDIPPPEKREIVSRILKHYAERAQEPILRELYRMEKNNFVRNIEPMWLGGSIVCESNKEAIESISRRGDVELIVHNKKVRLIEAISPFEPIFGMEYSAVPADVLGIDWHVTRVNADDAWGLGYTGLGVIVSVLDSGVRYTHQDLSDHMWINSREIPGNGADDDLNGYIDDIYGYDFVNGDGNPIDDNGHGTVCAGLVAGDGTGGTNTGVAPDARIMALKVINASGSGSASSVLYGLQYSIDMGANIVSMSLGWENPDTALRNWYRSVMEDVFDAGLIVSVSAGNGRSSGGHYSVPLDISSPADCPSPSQSGAVHKTAAVAVGATTTSNSWASFSSYGPTRWNTARYNDFPWPPGLKKPDMSAPGQTIRSLSYSSDLAYTGLTNSGTSMSAPIVAGGMALALQKNPALTPHKIDSLLQASAWDRGPAGKDSLYGAGILDCQQLMNITPLPTTPILRLESFSIDDSPPVGNGSGVFDAGETVKLLVTIKNVGATASSVTGTATVLSDPYITAPDPNGSWGSIATGASVTNTSNPFQISASSITPPAHGARIRITMTAGALNFYDTITVNVGVYPRNYANHRTQKVKTTITNFGAFGYFDPQMTSPIGQGFAYQDTNTLYGGGYFLGISYNDVITGERGNASEFKPISPITTVAEPTCTTRFATYADPNRGITLRQISKTYNFAPNEDFILLKSTLRNLSTTSYSNLYLGFYLDFDIHYTYSTASGVTWYDRGRYVASSQWAYMWDSGSPQRFTGYVGIAGLSSISRGSMVDNPIYIYPEGMGWVDTVKYNFLTGAFSIVEGNPAKDWSVILVDGPFNLAPGASRDWGIAVVAGDNLTDWQNNVATARGLYASVHIEEGYLPENIFIKAYPNPFNSSVTIEVPSIAEKAEINIFDLSGRIVRSFDIDSYSRKIVWNGSDTEGRLLPSGVYLIKYGASPGSQRVLFLK